MKHELRYGENTLQRKIFVSFDLSLFGMKIKFNSQHDMYKEKGKRPSGPFILGHSFSESKEFLKFY